MSLDDFFDDDNIFLDEDYIFSVEFEDEYSFSDEYEDERELRDHFIPVAHKLSSDDEVPRKTLADVFPDIYQ